MEGSETMYTSESHRMPTARSPGPQIVEDAWLDWRYAAASTAKSPDSGEVVSFNDDASLAHHVTDALYLGVVDVATRKSGITGAEIQAAINSALASASSKASPAEIIGAAHCHLSSELGRRSAQGGACLLIVRATSDGTIQWAHTGDGVVLHWKAPRWWTSASRLELLNTRQRQGHGLVYCVGMRRVPTPLIEEGSLIVRPGDRLLIASDGIFHDAMRLSHLKRWIDAYERNAMAGLTSDLVRKIDVEARLSEPSPDDRTVVVLERSRPLDDFEQGPQ